MESNIRTEVSIGNPGICPVARASKDANTVINDISRSSVETPDGTVVEEFTLGQDASTPKQAEITKVFAYDSHSIYRFSRERERPCVCETIERFGCPVSEIYARDGELYVSFYAPDIEKSNHD